MATVADDVVAALEGLGPPDTPARVQQGLGILKTAAVLGVADPGAEGRIVVLPTHRSKLSSDPFRLSQRRLSSAFRCGLTSMSPEV